MTSPLNKGTQRERERIGEEIKKICSIPCAVCLAEVNRRKRKFKVEEGGVGAI